MELTRIFDLLDRYKSDFKNKTDVFGAFENGTIKEYSSQDYIENATRFGYGLINMGFEKGDKIATVTQNRPEWNFADMGMSMAGLVHVPIYPTISTEEYAHIFEHSEAKMIIVSDKYLYDKLKPVADKISTIKNVYTFDKIEGIPYWYEVVEEGIKNENYKLRGELKIRKDSVSSDDLFTIIYTSGTTGMPKGVMLTHRNFVYQIEKLSKLIPLNSSHRALSFLPLCHVLERIGNYAFQYMGISITYAEGIDKISENIKTVKPHTFITVPRLLERLYDKILEKGKNLEGTKKLLFFRALDLGLEYEFTGKSMFYNLKLALYNKLIFSKWREALGGNIRMVISGGAALQERLAKVFTAANIPVYEGYGLTETAPVICVNHPGACMFGTVGQKLGPEQEVKIASDGEILFKGPNLMKGYFNDPQKTNESIDAEGWFHTGDIGKFVGEEFLKITDRKKEIFKLSTGKYVAPQVVENIMKESLFIEQIMVCGENQKFTAALISPNFQFLHDWCRRKKIIFRDNDDLIEKPRVIERIKKEVDKFNQRLGKTEQIKKITLVPDTWSPDTGELSPTLKLKRRFVKEKYTDKIKEIFS